MTDKYIHLFDDGTCRFKLWAPLLENVVLHIVAPEPAEIAMTKNDDGYFIATIPAKPGTLYYYRPENSNDFPDPASQYQPEGVHGPSMVIDHNYNWNEHNWKGLPLESMVFYELHAGTFTPDGTFDAIIPRLDDLVDIGINAIELMPVAQFPGNRNWGYDGVYPYAVQNTYGGPEGLKRLVDACHQKGIAVFLDVVYNHLGPEGNYFAEYGPYFSKKYQTPWGNALNFDDDWSDGVRDFFAYNAIYWFQNYHIDGLRLDAINMVYDNGALHFWEFINQKVEQLQQHSGRPLYMVAESDLNSPKVTKPAAAGGFGFDAQWLDDFHHALYVTLNQHDRERYADFSRIEQLAKAYTDGFVHSGEYVEFRKRKHGISSAGVSGNHFVVFNQNHDQIGNRVQGERLSMLVDFERLKLAAAAIFLSPYIPLMFMGEEYADDSPFFYFVSHSEKALIKAVQEGRKKEFEKFNWKTYPPDPQSPETFSRSVLNWEVRNQGKHQILANWYKKLICLRRDNLILQNFNKNDIRAEVGGQDLLILKRQSSDGKKHLLILFNLSDQTQQYILPDWSKEWLKILDSKEPEWMENKQSTVTNATGSQGTVLLPPIAVMAFSTR